MGTSQDVGFTFLKTGMVPGQDGTFRINASIDEIDEALVYSNSQYILSDGVQGEASAQVIAQVEQARQIADRLSPADFGRPEGQVGGRAVLTEAGRARAAELAGGPLDGEQLVRLNMAAAARFEYVQDRHYLVFRASADAPARVYIIDQTTHEVLYDPKTATESRWNGGLAQAVEARHGLAIRDDAATSKSVSARELYGQDVYGRVTGASGTALGKGGQFAAVARGVSAEVADIPRYYRSRLAAGADHVSPDLGAKFGAITADTLRMQAGGAGLPQLVLVDTNDKVGPLAARFTEAGVEFTKIDAEWFMRQGTGREAAFAEVIEEAGKPGSVLLINMQGARGVDIPLTAQAKALGGLHVRVTARSGLSADIDVQAENRASRSGDPGSVSYYVSPDDEVFALSANPHVKLAVIQYAGAQAARAQALSAGRQDTAAQAGRELTRAQAVLRNLVPLAQAEAGRRLGLHAPAPRPGAPPAPAAAAPAGSTPPSAPARPPSRPPPVPPAGGGGTAAAAVPFAGTATRSGFYLPAGPARPARPGGRGGRRPGP